MKGSVKFADEHETDSAGGVPVRTPINAALLLMFARASGLAQQPPFTINQAVQQALEGYPAVRSALEQVSAAAAEINLARTAYLPTADFLGQVNRATHNNVFGQLLPQSVIPTMTGPALGTNTFGSVWGTAVGTLVSWEPFDFGLRKANVDLAFSVHEQQHAQVNVTKLQVGAAAADAFFTILAAQQTVIAAGAGVERATVLNQAVEVLVNNQLRPGADASRTQAELALARTQLIQAEDAVDIGRAALGQLLGVRPQTIAIKSGPLLELPGEERIMPFMPANHPTSIAQNLAIEEIRSRERVLDRSYFPRFELQGAFFARSAGIQSNGETRGAASGLGPNTGNWALGMTVTFPVFDIASIRARKKEEVFNERAERARYEQTLQDLTGQMEKAQAALAGARRVAQNTPIELEAARVSELQANARYRSGLGTIVEVAETERILTQAQIDDALAKLSVWRALLEVAVANGDVQPFLQQTQ
jgi:outer membrane protein TolC